MEKYLVYLNVNQIFSPILCDSLADAEELILSLAEERMYEQYCWYVCNDIEYKINPTAEKLLRMRTHTENTYSAYLLKCSHPIYAMPISTY